jgi:hypothetical protein
MESNIKLIQQWIESFLLVTGVGYCNALKSRKMFAHAAQAVNQPIKIFGIGYDQDFGWAYWIWIGVGHSAFRDVIWDICGGVSGSKVKRATKVYLGFYF